MPKPVYSTTTTDALRGCFPPEVLENKLLLDVVDNVIRILEAWEIESIGNWYHRHGRQLALQQMPKHKFFLDRYFLLLCLDHLHPKLPIETIKAIASYLPAPLQSGLLFGTHVAYRDATTNNASITTFELFPKTNK